MSDNPATIVLYRLDALQKHADQQDVKIAALEARIEADREARAREDRNRLIAGVMLLGSLVTGLVGIIWAYRGVIFAGKQ